MSLKTLSRTNLDQDFIWHIVEMESATFCRRRQSVVGVGVEKRQDGARRDVPVDLGVVVFRRRAVPAIAVVATQKSLEA